MPRFSLAALLVAAACVTTLAGAWTFRLDNMKYPPYSHDGYRPYPHWRIGVWSYDSGPARAAPSREMPFVYVNVTMKKTAREYTYFLMYSIDQVEHQLYKDNAEAHPCQYLGQQSGPAALSGFGTDAIRLIAGNEMANPDGESDSDRAVFSQRAEIRRTGLYAFTFMTCRHFWRNREDPSITTTNPPANPSQWIREFDAGSNTMVADGSITVFNPYGHLPGQAYGFIPWYAILFAVLFLNIVVLAIRMMCVGRFAVIPYHWASMAGSMMSFWVMIFIIAYLGEINEKNEDKEGIYVAGYLFGRARDGVVRIFAAMFAHGWGVQRQSLRFREKLGAGIYFFVYFLFGVISLLVADSTGRKSLSLVAVTQMNPGPMHVTAVILDFIVNVFIVVIIIYCTRETMHQMEHKSNRRSLYIATMVLVGFYTVFGVLVAVAELVNGEMHERPMEREWKAWWLQASIMDGAFTAGVIAFTMIWFPRKSTTNLPGRSFTDNADYAPETAGGPAGGGFQSIDDEVDYGHSQQEMDMRPANSAPPAQQQHQHHAAPVTSAAAPPPQQQYGRTQQYAAAPSAAPQHAHAAPAPAPAPTVAAATDPALAPAPAPAPVVQQQQSPAEEPQAAPGPYTI